MTKDFCDICKKEMEIDNGGITIRTVDYPNHFYENYGSYEICGDCVDKMKDLIKEISAID